MEFATQGPPPPTGLLAVSVDHVDLGQRPHTTALTAADLTFVDIMTTRAMSDAELKVFVKSIGLQIQDDWDRERINKTMMTAMYEASRARVNE